MKNILLNLFWLSGQYPLTIISKVYTSFPVFSVGVKGTPYKPENEDGPYYPCQSTPDLYAEDGLPAWRPLILAHRSERIVSPN